ncbi:MULTISPECIES: esterase/lipase family protein [Cyanophyceae]|uniref:Lipase n=1 Tax=Nodularia spumigena CENA596 TaxID=1819295 RepID=A0A166IZS0_NODSP|nr:MULTISPECIES: triacylglycerol lipase [Cyanophyceae]MDB9356716.1 triacylglycerol lipase [Nodularia spumigena CS-587/03]KZL49060.1 lipase [Nodularia spumigena CENA596]MDB9304709.1 triacylglycerol lipase [Nodularia spumigena CS-591/12]MDB9319978.1 triacylglycerol lipase [Nodularia spumigena CS-590/01A]MDB9320570.1 triacylglycerol lipase [Nodularia spumigena CS-591/07A]
MNTKNQQRNSVLLIHGIDDTGAVFNPMASYLRELGSSVHTLDLVPNNGAVGLDILAQQIADYVVNTFAPEEAIDLVGFSMGGIVSRYYVQRLGGINRVQRFITISSPHHGTVTAYASQRYGCLQMRRNSEFIQDLNSDAVMLGQLNFTSIWTPYDLMIVPANSSQMPLGKEVVVPVVLHSWMLTDSRSLAAVASALAEPVKPCHQFGYADNCQKSPLGGGNI